VFYCVWFCVVFLFVFCFIVFSFSFVWRFKGLKGFEDFKKLNTCKSSCFVLGVLLFCYFIFVFLFYCFSFFVLLFFLLFVLAI
jgi:hypothetical protein